MKNALQDQLLKAGLAKKSQVAQAAREQAKQRQGKAAPAPDAPQREAERLRAERVERDRALAAERNAHARVQEQRAQARQIIETQRVRATGEIEYRFVDGKVIRSLLVDAALRTQLASGALVIARHGDGHALLPRAAAEKVRARDATMIVLDHGGAAEPAPAGSDDDAYYARFQVPDDLVW
ncbi:DUF2058 domain-containing protein [Coralloluteibacterium stylophorae]|uniref:DUF2058 domain-containing protein n=1 Tax=Coralloluteibacterium stylophorae TaxID=1776034 RepID=A0A8J7VQA7_9GAMM|nr:DUF2058 domain-containing protein [Coralloluteibacterium stylophorae]MBS7456886.1 DUF2058 domain-containing protein [Coralloluteibacterium stylophorae]